MTNFRIIENTKKLQALKSLIGKSVESIFHVPCFFDGQWDKEDYGDLGIKFSDGTELVVSIMPDGESIDANFEPLEVPEPFKELGLSWKKINLLEDNMNLELSGIYSIVDSIGRSKVLSGIKFEFTNGDFLAFSNNGDNSLLGFRKCILTQ